MSFWCQNVFQKTNEIFSRISALASKKKSIKKSNFVGFLTPKGCFEINWPLLVQVSKWWEIFFKFCGIFWKHQLNKRSTKVFRFVSWHSKTRWESNNISFLTKQLCNANPSLEITQFGRKVVLTFDVNKKFGVRLCNLLEKDWQYIIQKINW